MGLLMSDDFRPQRQNANLHTPQGADALSRSIESVGWIGAVTVANDGEAFDGSLRLETITTALNSAAPIVVDTDGTRPVIVRRTDIANATQPKARLASVLANQVAEVNWDGDVLSEWSQDIDLTPWFNDEEMAAWDVEVPDFEPVGEDEQGRLDQIAPNEIDCVCPNCSHRFIKQI